MALHYFANVLVVAVVALLIPQSPGAEAPRANVVAELSDFQVRVEPPEIKAGQITFEVRNVSKTNIHEMVLVATDLAPARLPYQTTVDRVDESKLRRLGEVSDLRPGASRHLTLRLKPGRYVLLCNEAGHYKAGMVTVFTVTR